MLEFSIRTKKDGGILSIRPDSSCPDEFAFIDVLVDDEVRTKMVTGRYREEHGLVEGDFMTWDEWTMPIFKNFLNAFVNTVKDVTGN
jgi:hypothetical protein